VRNFRQRLARLESAGGFNAVLFKLDDGSKAGIPRKDLLVALSEACAGADTRRAHILLHARKASDGNRLFEVAQALRFGPEIQTDADLTATFKPMSDGELDTLIELLEDKRDSAEQTVL
jgi:hypothetical protein